MHDCNHIPEVLATSFFETLRPTRCVICDAPGAVICADCAYHLPFIDPRIACARCGAPFGRALCTECTMPGSELEAAHPETLFPFHGARSALSYEAGAKKIIRAYKDGGELRLDASIASFICQAMRARVHLDPRSAGHAPSRFIGAKRPAADWTSWADAIVPIPASEQAILRRGFDHMARIANICARWTGLPAFRALACTRRVLDQRSRDRAGRQANRMASFRIADASKPIPARVIVIDDVFTTGATLSAAASTLLEAGASEVVVAVCARVW